MKKLLTLLIAILQIPALAQERVDSLSTKQLEEVVIKGKSLFEIERLSAIQGTHIWSGKKNEVINVQNLNANIAEKTPRQIFAKVPGVFVYDMDGSGNQTNISTRGLDPHRGWEFNIRRNGVITNSDMYGYPASHYSMPMEAVERIEMIRGTAALQYGAQFGGMLNYVAKKPDSTQAISFESVNSAGSFGLLSTYNAISGKLGKFQYTAYYSKRVSEGYRDNGRTTYDAQSVVLSYKASDQLKFTAELSRSNYIYQIPGPLTDSMFYANPKQSTRARNYFNPEIWIPSISMEWKLNSRTTVSWTSSAVLGYRNSVQFDKPANVVDAIDPVTLAYAPRQVDIDNFNSYTSELRMLCRYTLFNWACSLAAGVQYFNNDLHRQQLGKGTTGSDFDLSLSASGWGRDMHFKTQNVAFFVENKFQVLPNLAVSPGVRFESGQSVMSGTISYYDADQVPNTIAHQYPLFGINSEYQLRRGYSLYAGWSQAYRPVIFKDIIPASVYEIVDKDLKDAYGYNLEAGFRGNSKSLRWDIGVFRLQYNNRLGSQATYDENGVFYLYRTNIGNSVTEGAEIFVEYGIKVYKNFNVSLFTSTALFNGRYADAQIRSGETNISVNGNKIESVPNIISRNGVTFGINDTSISFLYGYTGETYADALNTKIPSDNGAVGLVPAYGLLDINSSFKISSQVMVRVNVNNVTNKQYFTKRPSFYPGPGVWSSDGRSVNVTLGFTI
ncbi:MAG: TonB-dependent receptor [Bacteroidota bacterium]